MFLPFLLFVHIYSLFCSSSTSRSRSSRRRNMVVRKDNKPIFQHECMLSSKRWNVQRENFSFELNLSSRDPSAWVCMWESMFKVYSVNLRDVIFLVADASIKVCMLSLIILTFSHYCLMCETFSFFTLDLWDVSLVLQDIRASMRIS